MLRERGLHYDEILALFLSSFPPTVCLWAEYRHSLPDKIPYHLNWSTASDALPEPYLTRLKGAREAWRNKHERIIQRLSQCELPIPDDLELGWIRLNTRTVYLDSEKNDDCTANWALVPFLDCLNHSADASTKTRTVKGRFELVTLKQIKKGEQVFISYGQHSDTFLLVEYGFIIGGTNVLNFVDFLSVDIIQHVALSASSKRARVDVAMVAREYGFDSGLGVDHNGPTWSLVRFVASVCLSRDQFVRCVYDSFDEWDEDARSVVAEQMEALLNRKIMVFNAAKRACSCEPVLVRFLSDQISLLSGCKLIETKEWS